MMISLARVASHRRGARLYRTFFLPKSSEFQSAAQRRRLLRALFSIGKANRPGPLSHLSRAPIQAKLGARPKECTRLLGSPERAKSLKIIQYARALEHGKTRRTTFLGWIRLVPSRIYLFYIHERALRQLGRITNLRRRKHEEGHFRRSRADVAVPSAELSDRV
ncbi:unnamed protein product [Trichogramma brassicae]|uniref:Uncharacterized protein n=1 Tax=Trichogramma brassicae TaxID=86971 RepID=A0A6H5HVD4_9HYME|nr:unnamed protein product [Trichogramma brassicae]